MIFPKILLSKTFRMILKSVFCFIHFYRMLSSTFLRLLKSCLMIFAQIKVLLMFTTDLNHFVFLCQHFTNQLKIALQPGYR
jgi:hypothetical protein